MGEIEGVLPVLVTPYDEQWRIDEDAVDREVNWAYDNGANGVVVAMVSEVLRLGLDERRALSECVVKANADRGPVIISVGAESTLGAVRLAEHAAGIGATAVMATPPLTVRAKDVLIRGYYEAIADAVTVPLIIQDSSGYLGSPLPVSVQAQLFERYGPRHVMFKPEAAPIGPTLTELHRATGGEARVFDGSGGQALVDCFRRGLSGTMPGPDLVWAIAALWQALRAGDDDAAYQINGSLVPIVGSLSTLDAYIVTAKYLLVKQGVLDSARQREPRGYELDGASTEEIDRLFARLVDAVRKAQSRPKAGTSLTTPAELDDPERKNSS